MPKAILEFNLPEETEEFDSAKNGASLKFAIQDFDSECLRRKLKYEKLSSEEQRIYQEVRTALHEYIGQYLD